MMIDSSIFINHENYSPEPMEWQKYIEKVHNSVRKSDINPEEYTEKGFYEWIMKRDDVNQQIVHWLDTLRNSGKDLQKNEETAKRFKEEGNTFFKRKDYPSSVKSYTESAKYAPFEKNDFSMAIANRSAAFFHMCRYQESLDDIALAISCNYPEAMSWKLHLRAAQCHLKLRQGKLAQESLENLRKSVENSGEITPSMKNTILKQAKDLDSMAVESQERYEKPTKMSIPNAIMKPEDMLKKNNEFPFASSSLIRKRSPTRGRYVIAGKPIKKGDVLFVEKPFAWVPVTHGNDVTLCSHCCGCMDDALIPCRGCLDALYCSSACWNEAWSYHQWECPGYHMGLWQQIGVSHLAFKILLISTITSDLTWFNDVQKLVTNVSLKTPDDVFGLAIASMMLVTYMERFTNFFDLVDINESIVEKFEDKSLSFDVDLSSRTGKKHYVGAMLLRHSLQMLANAYAVTTIGESDSSQGRTVLVEEQQRIAAGAYPSASMLNHSCDPTVIHTFWKNWLIVKAVKNVPEGQEIFNCYGPYFKRMSKNQRQKDLWNQYSFHCQCEACANPLFDHYTDRFDGLKCPKCCGSSLRSPKGDSQRCFDCGATSAVDFDEALQRATELSDRGMQLADNDQWAEAIPCFEKCLAIRRKYMYENNEDMAITYDALGQCHAANGRWLNSISYLDKSLAAVEERYGLDSIEVANELNKITDVCLQYLRRTLSRRTAEYRDTFIKTRKYVDRALSIISLTGGPWNDRYQEVNDKKEQLSGMLEQLRI